MGEGSPGPGSVDPHLESSPCYQQLLRSSHTPESHTIPWAEAHGLACTQRLLGFVHSVTAHFQRADALHELKNETT